MKIHHSTKKDATKLQTIPGECAICIGTFDGMHLGHQQLLNITLNAAAAKKIASALLTFEPAPGSFFNHNENIARIMSIKEKESYLQSKNLEHFVCLDFNSAIANLTAEEFISEILHKQLQAKIIIVGDDFRFGKNRQGDLAILENLSAKYDYRLITPETVYLQKKRISSSWIRNTLENNNLELAKQLLGRSYSIEGTVITGDQRGRELGFPTANIALTERRPLHGVFVIAVSWEENKKTTLHYGVANLGTRPSVDGKSTFLEAHLFDFAANLYDKRLQVSFLHPLRAEKKFTSLEELTMQIQQDVNEAKSWLQQNNNCNN